MNRAVPLTPFLLLWLLAPGARAQDTTSPDAGPRDPSSVVLLPAPPEEPLPGETPSSDEVEAMPPEPVDAEEEVGEEEERRVPIIPTPPRPGDEEEEEEDGDGLAAGETVDEGFELPPVPDEPPEFRIRAGAGVALPTAGPTVPWARFTQDFEIQLHDVAPFYFGVGGAEILATGFVIGTVGLNAGLAAWVAQDPLYRLQGAIHLHIGAAFGGGFVDADVGGEIDLRMLLADDILELHARGGFFTLNGITSVDITGGLGVAF